MDIQSPFLWLAVGFVAFTAVFAVVSLRARSRRAKTVSNPDTNR